MYCNSCLKTIPVNEIVYCKECGVPLHIGCANKCLDCGDYLCDDCFKENRFRCSDCVTERKEIKSIRRSYLKQYQECPHSLYLQLIEGITPPMNSYAELGILTHEIIEALQNGELEYSSAKPILENKVEEWNTQAEDEYSVITMELLEVGKNSIDNFMKMKDLFNEEFLTEHRIEFSIREDLPTINCTLDRISFVNGKIHIHDWKTGKPMAGKQLAEDLQPPIYIYAVFKEFGVMPDTFTLHYLDKNKNLTYKHTEGMTYEVSTTRRTYRLDVEEKMKEAEEILQNIKDHKFDIIEDKEHLWRCSKMCWYHKSKICRDSLDAAWKQAQEHNKEKDDKEER